MKSLLIRPSIQVAELKDNNSTVKSYKISTAANGLSCEENSFCTPTGRLRIASKIGDGEPQGAIFKARKPTGAVWSHPSSDEEDTNEDLVLSRILWLEGAEDKNLNTLNRYIYLHGTNHEDELGQPVSHGCIRFSNSDIMELFQLLEVGSEVFVEDK